MNHLLLELQDVDNHIAAVKRERDRLDDGAALRSERETLGEARDDEKSTLNRINHQRAVKEEQLQTAEEKLARQQQRLMTAKSAHEVNSLQRDIEALGRSRGDLDEA